MFVYRLESVYSGLGPFANSEIEFLEDALNVESNFMRNVSHISEVSEMISKRGVFGFISKEKYIDMIIKPNVLEKFGYVTSIYKPCSGFITLDYQIVFKKENLIKRIKFTDNWEIELI